MLRNLTTTAALLASVLLGGNLMAGPPGHGGGGHSGGGHSGGGHSAGGHSAGGGHYSGGGGHSSGAHYSGGGYHGGYSSPAYYGSGYRGGVNIGLGYGGYGYGNGLGYYGNGFGVSLYTAPRYYAPAPVYYTQPSVVVVPSYTTGAYYPQTVVTSVNSSPIVSSTIPGEITPLPMTLPVPTGPFPYDGGPVNPIPQPTPDKPGVPQPMIKPVDGPDGVQISFPAPAKRTLKYPAYGEK